MRHRVTAPAPRAPKGSLRSTRAAPPGNRWLAAATLGAACALSPALCRAQSATFYLDRLQVGGAPDDGVAVWRPQMGETTRLFGQLAVGFGLNPFRLKNEIDPAHQPQAFAALKTPVTSELITYATAGVEILDRVSVQAELPVIAFQGTNPTGDGAASANDDASPSPAAVMDARLTLRAIVFRTPQRTLKLGLETSLWLPTGNRFSYGSDGSTSGSVGAAAEVDLKRVALVLNTGVHFRPVLGLNDFHAGSEWTYAIGGFVPLRDGSIRLGAQIFGSAALNDGATFSKNDPLEWIAEGRLFTDRRRQGFVSLAGGTRLFPGYSPDFRLLGLVGYWFSVVDTHPPSPPGRLHARNDMCADSDHDGICDDVDLCPLDPEDHKPPDPNDGCPAMPDDDEDGIPNAVDACPNAPGPADPDPKKNGCPIFIKAPPRGGSEIVLLKPIEFATAKSTILPQSFGILDEVVKFLAVNPKVLHLAIEGHTDNRGPDDLNERLSDDRAHSVMKYLVEHGVAQARLSAKGFGPHRPIQDNATAEGRQKNRRVDFRLTD